MSTTKKNPVNSLNHRDRAKTKSPEAFRSHASTRTWPGQRPMAEYPSPPTLQQMLNSYLLEAAARRLSPATRVAYSGRLTPFLSYVGQYGIVQPGHLTSRAIRAYLASLEERDLSASTIYITASTIRTFCNFMVSEEVLGENPMHNVQMPRRPESIPTAFTLLEFEKLILACTNPRDRAICLFLVDTGCRTSEFVALNIEDVDLNTGSVKIRQGKGGKGRQVYFGAATRDELVRYLQGRRQGPLWLGHRAARRLSASGLWRALNQLGRRAGVMPCYPLLFRRSFALWSIRAGMNVYCLQRLMGHKNLMMLQCYLALTRDDVQGAHRQHGAVDSLLDGLIKQADGNS